jgi:hypothetical protein
MRCFPWLLVYKEAQVQTPSAELQRLRLPVYLTNHTSMASSPSSLLGKMRFIGKIYS